MKPWLFGGGMISAVRTSGTDFNSEITDRFTAGTPDVASAVGLAAACEYLQEIGMEAVANHDIFLVQHALQALREIPEVQLVGPDISMHSSHNATQQRIGSVTFIYKGVHAHDVAQILDTQGVAVRSGHHCTMPLHTHFGWQATVRASFQIYNTTEEIDALVEALNKVKKTFL